MCVIGCGCDGDRGDGGGSCGDCGLLGRYVW